MISSEFKEHFAVRKADFIYGRITGPAGLEIGEYQKLFRYGGSGLVFDKVVRLGN